MKKQATFLALAAVAALSLGACSSVKKELGVGRNSPDEFLVVKRAPLTLPPDYGLRPPSSGEVTPASTVSNRAKTVLMGEPEGTTDAGDADAALLDKMGADAANPDIRGIINKENGYIELKNRTLVDKLMFWQDEDKKGSEVPTSVVNPKDETERLKKNKQEGKPVNAGEVPVIEKEQSTFDKLF